jgi:hypothetical protein
MSGAIEGIARNRTGLVARGGAPPSGHPVSLLTAVMVYNLVEQGVYANFSFSLPCFSCGQQQSSVASSTDSTSGVDTFAGVDTAGGQSASYSGVQTSSGSSADTSSSAACLSEAGSFGNGSFALSAVSYSGSGNESYSAQDSSVSSWSGSYSGGDSSSDVAGGSASWSSGASGCFASGSFGLSSYSFQGGGNGSSSSGESWQGNDNGNAESYAVGQSSQETDSVSQGGMQAGGNYYNSGYSYTDSAVSTATSASSAPGYSSGETWTEQNSEQVGLSGSANQTSSAQYAYQEGSGGGGNLNNASTASPNSTAPGAVVQMVAPDGSLVPNNGADQAAAGANTGGPGGDAPVPAAVAVQVTTNNTGQWLTTTAKTSWGAVVTFSSGSTGAGQRSGPSSGNAAVDAGQQFFNDPVGVKSLQQYRAGKILPLPQAPKAPASFQAQAWGAMQPLFQLLSTWAPQAVGAQKSQVQALLKISLPASGGEAKSGDPLVNFVDRALYNNGNPLAVGSAPMYGTYWDGMGHSAFEALDMAMPYVQAGIMFVTTWWGVGAAAGLGAWCIVKEALEAAGIATAVNVWGGAPPDDLALSVAGAFQRGALGAVPGLGNLLDLADSARAFAEGDVLGGVLSGMGAFRTRGACFSGEMLLEVEGGKKRADAIRVGDRLASRPEWEPEGPLAYQEVKEVFERWALIWEVEVGGQVLRTTGEHPFWVEGRRGWVSARELVVGDLLRTKEGRLVAVARVEATGAWEKVYNWEVEGYHTYYVSAALDAESIWAHNAGDCGGGRRRAMQDALRDIEEEAIRTGQPVPGIHVPGSFAREGIPTKSGASLGKNVTRQNNANGNAHGCHICGAKSPGTRSGNWVRDHIQSTSLTRPGDPQMIFPSCQACSDRQGWIVRNLRALREWLNIFGK